MRRSARVVVAVLLVAVALVVVAVAACVPSYVFSGATEAGVDAPAAQGDASVDHAAAGDAASDAPAPADAGADAPLDASVDALPDVDWGDGGPVIVANAGGKPFSTGFGYQHHVVFAENDGRFWFFYVDDTQGTIETLSSPDLVTWATQQTVSLGGATMTDGNNFSVGYASVGGADVIHIVADTTPAGGGYDTIDIRATISSGALTALAPISFPGTTAGGGCDVDGPQALVRGDGTVYGVTAWTGHASTGCDTNIYRSTTVDTGGPTWSGAFDYDGYFVSVPDHDFAHDLVDMPEAGVVMALWPDEDNAGETLFDSIDWALSPSFDGGGPGTMGTFPTASEELFYGSGAVASYDDWAACRLSDQDVHLVRHVFALNDAGADAAVVAPFEEVVYGGVVWQPGTTPVAVSSLGNTGVALVSDANPADGMLLVAIGTDNSLDISKWTSAAGWVALPSIPASAPRQSLAGTGCGSRRPAVFWTEGSGAYTIKAMDLGALLGP